MPTQLSFYNCFQLSSCWVSQLQVNSGFGKGVNSLCAKCIRRSSQITAPIQLVNGLCYTAVSHRGTMTTATFSVHKICKLLGLVFFFSNKYSKNAQRNLKGPARHSLGKKTSFHLLQSIAMISPTESTLQDFPVSVVPTASLLPLADLSPKSMLRNTSQHSSTLRAANLSEVIITSMSQVEGVEIFPLQRLNTDRSSQ